MILSLEQLKQQQLVWQASDNDDLTRQQHLPSGFKRLDQKLRGGWPRYGVVEIRPQTTSIGELRLLFPLLRQLADEAGLQAWIAPPLKLNAQTLYREGIATEKVLVITPGQEHQALWAAEQCLRSGCCRIAILFCPRLSATQAKRLQLAARQGDCLLFVIRQPGHNGRALEREESLPVSLRMKLSSTPQGLWIDIIKQQHGWAPEPFCLSLGPDSAFHPQEKEKHDATTTGKRDKVVILKPTISAASAAPLKS